LFSVCYAFVGHQACDAGAGRQVASHHFWRRWYWQRCQRNDDGKLSLTRRGLDCWTNILLRTGCTNLG